MPTKAGFHNFRNYTNLLNTPIGLRLSAMPRQRSILNENTKIGVVVHVVQNKKIFVISRCCFAEDGKEMYKDLQRRCRAIVLLIKPFVLCLRSLLIIHRRGSRCPENAELRPVTFL